jgi:hypothetical protein
MQEFKFARANKAKPSRSNASLSSLQNVGEIKFLRVRKSYRRPGPLTVGAKLTASRKGWGEQLTSLRDKQGVKRNRIPPLLVSVLLARRVQEGIRTSARETRNDKKNMSLTGT